MQPPTKTRFAILSALLAACGGVGWAAHRHYLPRGETLPGLRVDGETVAEGGLSALVLAHKERILARRVTVVSAADPERPLFSATLEELGVSVDAARALDAARRAGHEGDLLLRVDAAKRAQAGEIDVPLSVTVDSERFTARLARVKEAEDSPPISARLDLEHHTVVPERAGRYLDALGAVAVLESAAHDPFAAKVVVPVAVVAPRVTGALAAGLDVSAVVAEYETYFSRGGDQARRGKNIDVAASKLDGVVLLPGELVSFNQLVGERSEENGFSKSWEIFKGEMVEGVGGGTCQVASTFHAAAFFAGLEVIERLPHSRPSAYIPMGLDSTVVFPIVDLKVRNPFSFPLVVHSKTVGSKLKIELLGQSRPLRVSFKRELDKTLPYSRKVVIDPDLSGNKVVVKQHGIRGFKITRERILTLPDGTKRTEKNTDAYPPTTEIYEVPDSFDAALLPPLPADPDAEPPAAGDAPPAPLPPPEPSAPSLVQAQASTELQMVDAPGAHAPTAKQANPEKTLLLRR